MKPMALAHSLSLAPSRCQRIEIGHPGACADSDVLVVIYPSPAQATMQLKLVFSRRRNFFAISNDQMSCAVLKWVASVWARVSQARYRAHRTNFHRTGHSRNDFVLQSGGVTTCHFWRRASSD